MVHMLLMVIDKVDRDQTVGLTDPEFTVGPVLPERRGCGASPDKVLCH
jgi:hypothetical protein